MEIELKKTKEAVIVDDDCAHFCRAMQKGRDGIIYVRWWDGGKQIRRALHRLIMGLPTKEVDHINGNRLDNRRCNLRLASRSENASNRGPQRKKNQHPYKGIKFHNRPALTKKWQAAIKVNGVTFSGKYYATPIEAARAYDELAIKHHGQFARLNFPDAPNNQNP